MTNRLIQRLDYVLLAMIIAVITLQPYFMHGAINFYEVGIYLPQINEVFHGKVLYRDIFVLRGPLEIFMPMSMMAMFGKHIGVLNAYFYFGTVLTLTIYAVFALKIFRTKGFAYLFTLVLVARTFPWSCYNVWGGIRFGLGILPILLAANFFTKKNALWLFFAGGVSSLAFWTSFELGPFSFVSIAAMLCLYGYSEAKDIKAILRYAVIYASGIITISAPFAIYLIANSAFTAYIDTIKMVLTRMTKVFDMSLYFNSPGNLKEFILAFSPFNHNFKYTLPFFFYACASAHLLRKFIKRKIEHRDIIITSALIYGAFLYKGAFRDIEGPQYRMALQPLLLIMFFYIEEAHGFIIKKKKGLSGAKRAMVLFLLAAVPLLCIGFSVSKYNKRFFIFKEAKSLIVNKKHAGIPYAGPMPAAIMSERLRGVTVPSAQAMEIDSVIGFIISRVKIGETVFTFPDLGAYNFFTDRPCLGRFCSPEFSFIASEWFNEMMSNLKNKKPDFVICAKDFSKFEPYRPALGKYVDEVNLYLSGNYEVVKAYSAVNILRRR